MNYNTKGFKIVEIEGMTCLYKRKGLFLNLEQHKILSIKSEDEIQDFMETNNLNKINFFRVQEQFDGMIAQIKKETIEKEYLKLELEYLKKFNFMKMNVMGNISLMTLLNESYIEINGFVENCMNFYDYENMTTREIKKLDIKKDFENLV